MKSFLWVAIIVGLACMTFQTAWALPHSCPIRSRLRYLSRSANGLDRSRSFFTKMHIELWWMPCQSVRWRMRTASGLYYGRVTLPRWGAMQPAGQISMSGTFSHAPKTMPSSQPTYVPIHPTTNTQDGLTGWSPHSQPMVEPAVPGSQPAHEQPSSQPTEAVPGSQPSAKVTSSQPTEAVPGSQPSAEVASSQPTEAVPRSAQCRGRQ